MAHDQHDEEYVRTHWHEYGAGGDELHASTTAPSYKPARVQATVTVKIGGQDVVLPLGSMGGAERVAKASGRRSYR